jgi:hypothetical protein
LPWISTLSFSHIGIPGAYCAAADHTEPTAIVQESADIGVVISAEEAAPGGTSSEITSAKHTMGSSWFFTSPTAG